MSLTLSMRVDPVDVDKKSVREPERNTIIAGYLHRLLPSYFAFQGLKRKIRQVHLYWICAVVRPSSRRDPLPAGSRRGAGRRF